MLEDFAILTGGRAITEDLGITLEGVTIADLGSAKKITIDKDTTTIIEGAGEDPYLVSVMAAAQVVGFQGAGLRSPNAVLATVKHFAAYGGAEAGRDYNVVSVSERDLWEVYLPPYEAGARAGAGSFMAAFNEINGDPSDAN